jgi:hypothetical protein
MNIPKHLIILLLLLVSSTVFAQKKDAIILFRNGEKLKGLARIKTDQTVKFRKDKTSEARIYTFRDIKALKIEEDFEMNTYHYKMIKKKNVKRPKLLKLCVKGKMSLYSEYFQNNTSMGGMGGTPIYSIGGESTFYYICMNDNHIVEPVTKVGNGLGRSLRKTGLKFFKDCPVIAEKIRNKTYKSRDIELVVYEYNLRSGN